MGGWGEDLMGRGREKPEPITPSGPPSIVDPDSRSRHRKPSRRTEDRRKETMMSAVHPLRGYPETPGPRNDIERLLQDMVASDNMEFSVVSRGHFFSVGLEGLGRET